MASIFSKIISGEIPCYKVAEDEDHIAFLDIQALKEGHTLVVPKKETDYIFELEEIELTRLSLFTKKVAIAIKKSMPCKKVGMAVIGLEVPHVHIHLIPINSVSEMNFSNPRIQLSEIEFKEISSEILSNF